MASANAVWGIDIGQCALKALKLRPGADDKLEAIAFDIIEHPKILSQPDADPDELVRGALEKFSSRNDWQGDSFVVGVSGQQTFARFCKLPPLDLKKDAKKIPAVVRYEASQQIPFDMDDVVWDYQTFSAEDSPDLEVGIFAMRKDLIRKHLDYFANVGITASAVQTIPCALYNFAHYELEDELQEDTALVLINVGSQNTDLVIVEPNSAWTRNIPLGGNSFTEALVRAFKLSFAKAESLKRTAATSKYARQIFQAMRPVFAELVAEIQRSIGFYSSTHRDVELKKVVALGNAFRLPGLQKYLENNLSISGGVTRPEKFKRLAPSATLNAPQFSENILSFASAYGLAVQGLGLARIEATLLPTELARIAVWKKKRLYFVATAACLGLAAMLPWTRNMLDKQALASTEAQEAISAAQQQISRAQEFDRKYNEVKSVKGQREEDIKKILALHENKSLVPELISLVYRAMPEVHPRLAAVANVQDLKELVENGVLPRTERRQFLVDSIRVEYGDDIDAMELAAGPSGGGGGGGGMPPIAGMAAPPIAGMAPMPSQRQTPAGQAAKGPGFRVNVSGRLLYGQTRTEAVRFLTEEYFPNLRQVSATPGLGFYIPDDDPQDRNVRYISEVFPQQIRPRGMAAAQMPGQEVPIIADPMTGEDIGTDWIVDFTFKVKLGEKPGGAEKPGQEKP